ncbi:MAG: hypothetical protein R3C01_12670 [Planctomycetaceae bacterium]
MEGLRDFPLCGHGGELIQPGLRTCLAPAVLGLAQVGPGECGTCNYRQSEVESQTTPPLRFHLANCRHLGTPVAGTFPPQSVCLHPRYGHVTHDDCRRCEDYLFPVLTPRLSVAQAMEHRRLPPTTQPQGWWTWPNVQQAERNLADERVAHPSPYVPHHQQRGIVIVGGGKYLPSAYVTARIVRHVGCELPMELWHLDGEVDDVARPLFEELGVRCVDADALVQRHPFRFLQGNWWRGWQLKAYAMAYSSFRELLFLDADCYPLRDPSDLFDTSAYREHGCVIWPDIESSRCLLEPHQTDVFGIDPFADAAAESGQFLVDRERCWNELMLALHYNAQADFTYNIIWGDKDTFPIAWKKLGTSYGRLCEMSQPIFEGIYQKDERCENLFLHRCTGKFTLGDTRFDSTPGQHGSGWNMSLPLEAHCREALNDFRLATMPEEG